MADNVTTQDAALSTVPDGTEIETYDTGDGHRQIVATGGGGSKTFTTAAPTGTAASVVAANADRLSVTIQNVGEVAVYLGSTSGVTTSNGVELDPGDVLDDSSSVDAWWAITAAGTADLRIVEVS
jgi:hypothetical protein